MTRVVDIDTAVVSHSFSRTAQLLLKENPVLLSRLNLFINQAFGEKYPLGRRAYAVLSFLHWELCLCSWDGEVRVRKKCVDLRLSYMDVAFTPWFTRRFNPMQYWSHWCVSVSPGPGWNRMSWSWVPRAWPTSPGWRAWPRGSAWTWCRGRQGLRSERTIRKILYYIIYYIYITKLVDWFVLCYTSFFFTDEQHSIRN